jgi:hypothetical protein
MVHPAQEKRSPQKLKKTGKIRSGSNAVPPAIVFFANISFRIFAFGLFSHRARFHAGVPYHPRAARIKSIACFSVELGFYRGV